MSLNASLGANSIAFTNFSIVENNDASIQFKETDTVVAEINDNGIVFDNSNTDLSSTDMNSAIVEVHEDADNDTQTATSASIQLLYDLNSSTSDSDPGSGKMRLNNHTKSSATKLYIDNKTQNDVDVRNFLLLATGEIAIYMQKKKDNTKYALFHCNTVDSSNSGYMRFINLSYQQGNGSWNSGKTLIVFAKRPGLQVRGATVPVLPSNSTGAYTLSYTSATQALAWQSDTHTLENTTVAVVNGTNTTYTASQLLGGVIDRDMTTGRTDTTPTAAQIVAVLNSSYSLVSAGATFHLSIHANGNHDLVVSPGTGVTINGVATITQNTCVRVRVVCTNVTASSEAVSMYIM